MRPIHCITTLTRAALTVCTLAMPPAGAQGVIEDVIVTATRIPRSVHDIAGTVSVMGGEDIERQIADDLDDLARYQPGVSMDTAGRGGNQGFIIRGIGGNRVLTIVDGVRSRDQYAAGPSAYGKDAYEIDDVRSVEVIRGPASVLYGADALGGAVLLHTKGPVDYTGSNENRFLGARLAGSSADRHYKLGLSGVVRGEHWGTLAQYTGRRFAEQEPGGGGGRLNPLDGSSHALLLKTTISLGERQALMLGLDAFREDVEITLSTDLGEDVSQSFGIDETERNRFLVRHHWHGYTAAADEIETLVYHQTSDGLQHTTQTRISYSFIVPADPSTYAGTQARRTSDFEFDQDVRGLSLLARKTLDSGWMRHTLAYGLTAETTRTQRPRHRCETAVVSGAATCRIAAYPLAPPEVFPNTTFPDTTTTRWGLFIQDEIVLGARGRLTLIPGVRHDRYEMDPDAARLLDIRDLGFDVSAVEASSSSANLGIIYDLDETIALFAQYAEGFRPPNFDESNQAFVNRAFGYATVPNAELRPETSKGIEVGLKAALERAQYSIAVYRNEYRDFIGSELVGVNEGVSLFQDRNIGEARIEGIELTGLWRPWRRWELHGALAYARGEDEGKDVPLDNVDPLTGVVGVRFAHPETLWSVEALLTLAAAKTRVSADDRARAGAYQVLDVIGHYRFAEAVSFRLGIYNLFDETYARWANVQGLSAADTEAIQRARSPGRNIRFSFDFGF